MNTIFAATVAVAAIGIVAPAMAQTTGYATLGYNHEKADDISLGSAQARMGLRFGRHLGVEGELSQGVKSDDITVGGVRTEVKARPAAAAYGVAYLPVGERADLFARVGYGTSRYRVTQGPVSVSDVDHNINYGVGGQYFFSDKDGVRVDYTRKTFNKADDDADTASVAYVRRF